MHLDEVAGDEPVAAELLYPNGWMPLSSRKVCVKVRKFGYIKVFIHANILCRRRMPCGRLPASITPGLRSCSLCCC